MASKYIMIPCDQTYKDMLREKAKEQGFTMSTYVRVAIAEKIKNDKKECINE